MLRWPKIYYGFYVAAACFFINFTLGEALWAFGLFIKPLEAEFGWSRADISLANVLLNVGYAPSAFVMGWLADKYGPRPILVISALLAGLGLSLVSTTQNLSQFLGYHLLAGLGAGATMAIPAATVQRWFVRRRGLVLGTVTAGVGLGGMVSAPLISFLISGYGWRTAYLVIGLLYALLISLAATIIIPTPEKKGLKPYGVEAAYSTGASPTNPRPAPMAAFPGFTTHEVVRMPALWVLVTVSILSHLPVSAVLTHIVPHAIDQGIAPAIAATALGLIGGLSIPGRILMGAAADRIGWQRGLALSNLGAGLIVFWLLITNSPWTLYIFVFIFGFFHGAKVPTQTGILGHFFGTRSLAEIIGIYMGIGILAGSAGAWFAGYIFDTTGSYTVAFIFAAVAYLLAGLLTLIVKPPRAIIKNSHSN